MFATFVASCQKYSLLMVGPVCSGFLEMVSACLESFLPIASPVVRCVKMLLASWEMLAELLLGSLFVFAISQIHRV